MWLCVRYQSMFDTNNPDLIHDIERCLCCLLLAGHPVEFNATEKRLIQALFLAS